MRELPDETLRQDHTAFFITAGVFDNLVIERNGPALDAAVRSGDSSSDRYLPPRREFARYQKRLTHEHAYDFLHGKDAIPHAVHETHRPPGWYDLDQLARDTERLLEGFEKLMQEDADFLVRDLDLPHLLAPDFYLARDLFSIGLDELGVLLAARGLEGVLRSIARQRGLIPTSQLADPTLGEMVTLFEKLKWKADSASFLPRDAIKPLRWLAETRNVGAHAQSEPAASFGSPRDLARVITDTAQRIWETHDKNRRRRLASNVRQK